MFLKQANIRVNQPGIILHKSRQPRLLIISGSSLAIKRLKSDEQQLYKLPWGISAGPDDTNYFKWNAIIEGPRDTAWEGIQLELKLEFTNQYPILPPHVYFVSNVFHPNIYRDGRLCFELLGGGWSPNYNVGTILSSIQILLDNPNPASPANREAANLFSSNLEGYKKRAKNEFHKQKQSC